MSVRRNAHPLLSGGVHFDLVKRVLRDITRVVAPVSL